MLKGKFKELSPIVKLFVIICVLVISLIIANVIGIILVMPIFKIGIFQFMNIIQTKDYNNHLYVNLMKYLQIWQTIGLFIIPAILAVYLINDNVNSYMKLNKKTSIISLLLALLIVFTSMPLIEWMVDLNSRLILPHQLKALEDWMKATENEAGVITKVFLNVSTTKGLFLNIFMIALLPAIGEEFMFRGLVLTFIKNWSNKTHLAVWISAIIFSMIHFQFYGFVPRMMLGALLGYLFVWSGSIWVSVFAHFINNGTAVISSYLVSNKFIPKDIDEIVTSKTDNTLFLILSIISAAILIYLFYNWEKRKKMNKDTILNSKF